MLSSSHFVCCLQFARGNLKLSEVLCESRSTILYRGTADGIRDKPIDVSVKALRGNYIHPHSLCYIIMSVCVCVCLDSATEDEIKILFYEMDLLSSLGEHPNLVSLLRVCSVERKDTQTD